MILTMDSFISPTPSNHPYYCHYQQLPPPPTMCNCFCCPPLLHCLQVLPPSLLPSSHSSFSPLSCSPSPFSLLSVCHCLLASGGYFMKGNDYFCSKDYHVLFGTKCKTCGEYVEGRVVTALGQSYHPHCFACDRCR